MSVETLEQLAKRTEMARLNRHAKREQKAMSSHRKPWYPFISKAEKHVVDHITAPDLRRFMEEGQTELVIEVLGVIANQKRLTGTISQDHQALFTEVSDWFEKSKIVDEAMNDKE